MALSDAEKDAIIADVRANIETYLFRERIIRFARQIRDENLTTQQANKILTQIKKELF